MAFLLKQASLEVQNAPHLADSYFVIIYSNLIFGKQYEDNSSSCWCSILDVAISDICQ